MALPAGQPEVPPSPDEVVDALIRACPVYRPGTRPIHAPGIGATGWFSASPVASSFTTAAHFTGARVPVTVRFSNATGDDDARDSDPLVRGMAVKFHLGEVTTDDVGVLHSALDTDLIAMTLPMFFVNRIERFLDFVSAATPVETEAGSPWSKVINALRLQQPPSPKAGTLSSDPGVFAFAQANPEAAPAVVFMADKSVPEGYTTCCYHAVHTFGLVGRDRVTRWARFAWEPVDGVRTVGEGPKSPVGNFLRQGLRNRIETGHAEFVLRIQLAEEGDDLADPTTPWPERRPRVVMGQLRLTDIPKDQVNGCELLNFNPTRLVPGVVVSADPILAARECIYRRSYDRRLQAYQARAANQVPAAQQAPAGTARN